MLEIIGVGFGRTGTHSLGLALEKLGFGPCYNVYEYSKNPDHQSIWNLAFDKKKINWEQIFQTYKASVEWPGVTFFEELVKYYPKAKCILTNRDSESWYESAARTIFDGLEMSAHNPDQVKRERSGFLRQLILEKTFGSQYWDKEFAIRVYEQHNLRVQEVVPAERLLVFDIRDGWEPMCNFLEKPIPDESFPKSNQREEFKSSEPEWAKEIKRNRNQNGT